MINGSRFCKYCNMELNLENAAKKNAKYFRNECKKCRSKQVQKSFIGNPKRQKYMREYIRKIGIVKQYPCETCNCLCYKKYARAFCSDKCRFLAYVDKQENCWIWIGSKHIKGYGKLCYKKNKTAVASRVAYELFKGPIEDNMFVCHSCDNPSCVNPDHLWCGTHMENMLDMIDKGRQYSKLLPTQVYEIRKLWQKGWSNSKLKEKFNVTSSTISNIIARRIRQYI